MISITICFASSKPNIKEEGYYLRYYKKLDKDITYIKIAN